MKLSSRDLARYVICLGSFLSNLSAGMLNVGLLDIAGEYGRPVGAVQWVITLYLLTIAVCLPLMGRLGDLRGKRSVHNMGFLIFLAGSVCCAVSPNLAVLLFSRVLQGVGAAMYQATNMALVVSLAVPERRGRALGIISTFVAAGTIIGPSLGGVVIQWLHWKANFWILAAMACLLWICAQRLIPVDKPVSRVPLDGIGAALFAAGLCTLVTALNLGQTWGWMSPAIWSLWAACASLAAAFLYWSRSERWRSGERLPFIQTGVFHNPTIRLGFLITILTYMAAFSTQIVVPFLLRGEMGYGPALAGLIVAGYPLSLIVSAPLSGDLSDRFGSNAIMRLGLTLMAGALFALSFVTASTSLLYVLGFIVLLGSSMGMITSPNSNLIMGNADESLVSFIGSMIALSRNVGMMFGSVLAGSLMHAASGYRSVFITSAAFVTVVAFWQVRHVRKEWKRKALSATR